MARKRASLAGRGVEILFGEEPENPPDSVSAPEEAAASNAGEGGAENPAGDAAEGMEAEWTAMLEAEAETATAVTAPGSGPEPAFLDEPAGVPVVDLEFTAEDGRPDWPAVDAELPDEPLPLTEGQVGESEEELPPLATTPIASSEPMPAEREAVHSTPEVKPMSYESPTTVPGTAHDPETPPSPMYTEPHVEPGEPPAPLPPPRDKPEAYDPVVQAKLAGTLYQTQTEAPPEDRLMPDGPTTAALDLREPSEYEMGQPSRVRRERDVMSYVGVKQRQALWDEVTGLYREVPEVLCTDELLDDALLLLREAQDILMERPRQFDVAQYKVGQVRSIMIRRQNTVHWTNTYGWGTFIYEALWILILGAAILFAPFVVSWVETTVGASASFISVADLWNTAAWGSVGGVLGALYSLYWHAAKVKDFDKQYLMWYVVQPVIGVIIGALVYVIIGAGFINLIGETASGQQTPLQLFPYAVACIAGFRQRFILEVVDRMIQFLTGATTKNEPPAEQPES
jgi:hypothetical protein